MENPSPIPLRRKPELILPPSGGPWVVKDRATGGYFHMGEQEIFLLARLDGTQSVETICVAFREQFKEPFSSEDLDGFLQLAHSQGFLQNSAEPSSSAFPSSTEPIQASYHPPTGQSLLYWRVRLFDPDRLFNWLAPRLWFLWTRTFVVVSLTLMLLALGIAVANWREMVHFFPRSWEMVLLAWLIVGFATTLHEFSHGLTCKHHGCEVHDIGFLLMFFVPCFYCDVSDAYLIKQRSSRLWVTLAGSYCDLFLWALAVFVWRLSFPGTPLYNLALVILSVCGVRIFFNGNPFLKLDGYYFVSDWVEVPNLRQRSLQHWTAHLRWLLWGADRPVSEARGRFLVLFGLTTWLFSTVFLFLMLHALFHYFRYVLGWPGIVLAGWLAWRTVPSLFAGFSGGEIMKMFWQRHVRATCWVLGLVSVVALLILVPLQDRASGTFRVRPAVRSEVRAPVSGFLQSVYHGEGSRVQPDTFLATMHIPDLASRLAQKEAEIAEAKAKLRLLEAGPRTEELRETRLKVTRATTWRDLAEKDLERKKTALMEETLRLTELINQYVAELENAQENLLQSKKLVEKRALAMDQFRDIEKRLQVAQAQHRQAQAQKRERLALGNQDAEGELARREKELADAKSALVLLEAGSRPEEIDSQRSHLDRLREELAYLELLKTKTSINSPLAGVIITPRLQEKVGQYFKEGDLICEIEDMHNLEIEVFLLEQDVSNVQVGQTVDLKARAVPFRTFAAKVDRIAPTAVKEKMELQSTITVYCCLQEQSPELLPSMTGYARVHCGNQSIGYIFANRILRYLRTEFWW
jgi:putative peptide zinc metalloprotease protein